MDRIYSRRRIKIPRLKRFCSSKRQSKKVWMIFIIALVAATTFYTILNAINPMFEELSAIKARNLATEIINYESNRILTNNDQASVVTTVDGREDNINILTTDVATVNRISNEIALAVEERLSEPGNESISMPLRCIYRKQIFSRNGTISTNTSYIQRKYEDRFKV